MQNKIVKVLALDGDKLKFRYKKNNRAGGNGFGISTKGAMYTLNTIDRHMVAIIFKRQVATKKDVKDDDISSKATS